MLSKESLEDTLLLAVKSKQLGLIKKCLALGGKGLVANIDGNRAAHFAVIEVEGPDNEREILRLLLDHGVDTSVENNAGLTPANIAAMKGDWDSVIIIANARPFGPNLRDYGYAVLNGALDNRLDVIQALSKANVPLDRHRTGGNRGIHFAARHEDVRLLQFFLQHGADPGCQNSSGQTPLHIAVQNKRPKAVALLSFYSTNLNIQNKAGETALDIANRMQFWPCIEAILSPLKFLPEENVYLNMVLFYLLTANANRDNPFSVFDKNVLKMIVHFAFPYINQQYIGFDAAVEVYVTRRADITSRAKLRLEKEYRSSVMNYIIDCSYFELVQNSPFSQSPDSMQFILSLIDLLQSNPEPLPAPVEQIRAVIEDFVQQRSIKSLAMTFLIHHKLHVPIQDNVLAVECAKTTDDQSNGDIKEVEAVKLSSFFLRCAKERRGAKKWATSANAYCAYLLLNRDRGDAQAEAIQSLFTMGSMIIGPELCVPLVVKTIVEIMLAKTVDRPTMDTLLRDLDLEGFFSKEPFGVLPEPTFFGSFFDTKAPYSIPAALAYVRIAALDEQDFQVMKERYESGSENKLDRILLRFAGEFSKAIEENRAPCLKLLVDESFRMRIETLQAMVIAPASIVKVMLVPG